MSRFEKFKAMFTNTKDLGIWSVASFFIATGNDGWWYGQHLGTFKTPMKDCAILYEIDWLRQSYINEDDLMPKILSVEEKALLKIT
jgi:hypothetical protein